MLESMFSMYNEGARGGGLMGKEIDRFGGRLFKALPWGQNVENGDESCSQKYGYTMTTPPTPGAF